MDLGISEKLRPIRDQVSKMVSDQIAPLDSEYFDEVEKGDRWQFTDRQFEIVEGLKKTARENGLWNLWLTNSSKGVGLSTVEYAYLAEEMGKAHLAPETFNCNAPDTGNMEVFEKYGTPQMKQTWLNPLLAGKIRSAYLMTEPNVASSDATNISLKCERDGTNYVLNGEKWWATGAGDPRCAVYIIMVRTSYSEPKHQQHSMLKPQE
jgi:acyl-CoA dehydrogenase